MQAGNETMYLVIGIVAAKWISLQVAKRQFTHDNMFQSAHKALVVDKQINN